MTASINGDTREAIAAVRQKEMRRAMAFLADRTGAYRELQRLAHPAIYAIGVFEYDRGPGDDGPTHLIISFRDWVIIGPHEQLALEGAAALELTQTDGLAFTAIPFGTRLGAIVAGRELARTLQRDVADWDAVP